MAVWSQVKVRGRGFSLRLIGCTPALYVTQKHRRMQLQLRLLALYKCYMPLPLLFCVTTLNIIIIIIIIIIRRKTLRWVDIDSVARGQVSHMGCDGVLHNCRFLF